MCLGCFETYPEPIYYFCPLCLSFTLGKLADSYRVSYELGLSLSLPSFTDSFITIRGIQYACLIIFLNPLALTVRIDGNSMQAVPRIVPYGPDQQVICVDTI
jgi:hypothetical protein